MVAPNRKMAHGQPCPYCGRKMEWNHPRLTPTRDHVTPKSHGGRDLLICCLQCNGIKGNMLPEVWAGFMAAHPGWWLLSKHQLRAIWRGPKAAAREAKWGPRQRQGSPPAKPVVVPPELIWTKQARPPWNNPGLIAATVAEDARLRTGPIASEPEPQPSQSDEACPP